MRTYHSSADPATAMPKRRPGLALAVAIAVAVVPVTGVALGTAPVPARAASAATPVQAEAPDYASEVFGDPWDYSDAADQNTDFASPPTGSVANGKYTMQVGPGNWFDPIDTVAGSVPYGRDGASNSVDTNRYRRLSFSMDQPNGGIGAIYWWTCREKSSACVGGTTFPLTRGSHVYDVALDGASTLGAKVPWTSGRVVALRVQPVVVPSGSPTVTVSLDWMRLHAGTSAQAALPPGDYGTYRIEAIPEPVVDSPSPADGQDLATATRGAPWEFTNSANAKGVALQNATLQGYGSAGLTAVNAGPDQNDPIVRFPVSTFSGSQYHWLSWDMTYDGGFSLDDAAGGGKMARVHWTVAGSPIIQIGNDMLTFSGANATPGLIDLNTNPLDENAANPRLGWSGQTIDSFRFDPNEDPGRAVWHLESLHLRADPAATNATTVKFHDAAWVAGTTADVLVGTGAPGTAYTTIASGVDVTSGQNSVRFALGSMPAGSYTVQLVLHHPVGGGALAFSKAPIRMAKDASSDPRGSLDEVSANGSTGATVRGWAYDPDATGATQVRVTEGSTTLATVATSEPRPDVAGAVPGAPTNSGFRTTVPLSAGQHTLCATAVNVGLGSGDVALGCRSVTVPPDTSHDARGSFDELSGNSSGVLLRGWAWDPDQTSATQVRVTEGTTTLATVGTSEARPDVARNVAGAPANTGWRTTIQLATGSHTVCATALNVGAGRDAALGCRTLSVVRDASHDARGGFDTVTAERDGIHVTGWAWDPDDSGASTVLLTDTTSGTPQRLGTLSTGGTRTDVARHVAGAPSTTGFDGYLDAPGGTRTICASAVNTGPGIGDVALGCKQLVVGMPLGSLDEASSSARGDVTLRGWAFDWSASTTEVRFYEGSRYLGTTTTSLQRPDVSRSFRGSPSMNGFLTHLALPSGSTHSICAYAINTPAGDNPGLGCRTVTVR
ncbi:hypothetical protein [Curtobacterium sp. RRHDQ10]|uniref:hypothetical protein n=1 Tax=Curtobacterium phyllosphaerae TaxID=3413379 RepID=UPI003BF17F91